MAILFKRFEDEIDHLKSEYKRVSIMDSSPDIGQLREIFIKHLLKNVLPSTVEICSGVLFDAEDNRSHQQDIIIYRRDMPKLSFGEGQTQFLFAEGALATVEIKSNINESEFKRAMDNVKSVKSLKLNRKNVGWGRPPKEIMCYIFGYDSVSLETFGKYVDNTSDINQKYLFDYITVLDKFSVFKNDGTVFTKQGSETFVIDIAARWTILGLFIHLMANISMLPMCQIDWKKYLVPPV